ncbi:DNA topoisomerase 3 [uncultured Cocleimonas sp.]|uniref:DNA topoisomerase III n=1 Tax=uncultured Cocleimonas sp. TaxID=1051587 RepID=UPI002622A1D3|nr:DNA topoisomerase 3 [uncultured Cocleimonas sp.]
MQLYLCEKPSQGRDIARNMNANTRGDGCLKKGNELVVTWAIGHLVEMANPDIYDPELKKWSFNTLPIHPDHWKNVVKTKTKKQYNIILKLIKQADHVVIATDADREGEVIARELLDAAKFSGKISRLWLSALDDTSIQRALNQIRPGSDTADLYAAGLARSRCDWLVGMNLTRLYTLKAKNAGYDGVLSVGRVQTPTLRMVVDRDLIIENFVATDFWDVFAILSYSDHNNSSQSFKAKWLPGESVSDTEGRCIQQQSAINLHQQIKGAAGNVISFQKQRRKQNSPLPFSLSTLTQFCDQSFNLGAKQVLDIAQNLYETHKVTTYPRSDCQYLPESQIDDIDTIFKHLRQQSELKKWVDSADPKRRSKVWNDKKITAHHAIIPTTVTADLSRMSGIERKVYNAICRYYLAQFYSIHEYDQTTILLDITGETFKATGRVTVVDGFKSLLAKPSEEKKAGVDHADTANLKTESSEQSLPHVAKGDLIPVIDTEIQQKKTKPPARYTEGTLSKAMENVAREVTDPKLKKILKETTGIGTVATRPNIFEVLLKRALLIKQGKYLHSSEAGRSLISALPEAVKSPGTTAMWEQSLESIATGKVSMDDFIASQKNFLQRLVKFEIDNTSSMNIKATAKHLCPTCNQALRRIKGKKGFFWACSENDCKYTTPDNRGKPGKKRKVVASNIPCPECGKPLRQITGKKGKFWGCSGYSDGCKFSAEDKTGKPVL